MYACMYVCVYVCVYACESVNPVFVFLVFQRPPNLPAYLSLSLCLSPYSFVCQCVWPVAGYLYLLHRPSSADGCFYCLDSSVYTPEFPSAHTWMPIPLA